jgi:SAM-dependent methyltransferase
MHREANTEKFWDQEVVDPILTSWMENAAVREYINRSISRSDEPLWPMDWFLRWLKGRRFKRALSIGCGTGALERDLISKNIVERIDAFDGSTNSLRIAQQEAAKAGMTNRIRYYAGDFNEPVLPRSVYDAVFIHQAAHHVAKLEKLYRAILQTLTDDGLLYLDEYIGPSRFYWSDVTIARHRQIYAGLEKKRGEVLILPVHPYDPSEAFRSDEILPQLVVGFDIEEMRGYGGNLLSVLYPSADLSPAEIERLIVEEKRIIGAGETPYYAIVVARPKRGLAKQAASLRYFAEPKLKRIARELAKRKPMAASNVQTNGS